MPQGTNTAQDGAAVKARQRVPVGGASHGVGTATWRRCVGSVRPQLPCTGLAWLQVHSMRGGQPLPKNPPAHSPCNSSKPKSLQNISGLAWKPGVWQRGTYPEQLAGGGPSPDGFLFWEQRPPGASRPARSGGAGAASATFPHPHSQSPPGAWAPWSGWRLTSDQEADRSLVCSLGALGSDGSPLTRPRKLCQHVPESSGRTPSQAPGPGMSWPRANSRPRGVCVTCKRPRVAEQRTTWQMVTQLGP